jgi:transaldolase/glucose-6-phosphate isomerase
MDTLNDLLIYGQSYWLDNLTREKINSGELAKRVSQQGLRGITSNPSIFYKAITGSDDYDAHIKELVEQGCSAEEIYDALTIADVKDACDILRPIFDSSKGTDGFVSLEVSPYLARDTAGSIAEARRLYKQVDRKNCFIKIPGTKEGIPAIEQCLYEGVNINITLLFSVERYAEIAMAYISAVKRRAAEGLSIDNIVSVASFFLSRIDVLVDGLLSPYIQAGKEASDKPQRLFGQAAIASARLAYKKFSEIFNSSEWKELQDKGAHVQRVLWASTSTKNPLYDDLRYVETLIGPNTINTLPDETIDALADHGELEKATIEQGMDEAQQVVRELREVGIDIEIVCEQLENEGIQKFIDSYNELMTALEQKRQKMLAPNISTQVISAGSLKKEIGSAFKSMDERQAGRRFYAKDPLLWSSGAETEKMIAANMGWLNLPDDFEEITRTLSDFAQQIKDEGFKHAVLLGMGGSSLCSEVALETFGARDGFPELIVLDNTEPAAIQDVQDRVDLEKTLFIAASKSGSTEETICFFKYYYAQLKEKGSSNPGSNFVAITDAGSPLVKMAEDYGFRKVFLNPDGIGGRYSVLSDFGLLPMALMGIDVHALMQSAQQMKNSSNAFVPAAANPSISLGTTLGICQRNGRDKITFVLSSSIRSFGYWVEQLLAESTGKEGKGLIPINGETLAAPDVYGRDRLFVHMFLTSDDNAADEQKLKALEAAGHPVVRIGIPSKIALGGEFYRWEIAVAISGMVIGINPFDQPNVEQSKKNTREILEEWKQTKAFKIPQPFFEKNGFSIFESGAVADLQSENVDSAAAAINAFLNLAKPGDYVALLPYFTMTDSRTKTLQQWRDQVRDNLKVATTSLNGPRYLHSTGQLHKGGPNSGLFILLVADEMMDLPIPDEVFGFATLHEAQSLGDFRSLNDKDRRAIRINLGKELDAGLEILLSGVLQSNKK